MRLKNKNVETIPPALIFQSMLGTDVQRQKANMRLSRQGVPRALRRRCGHRGVELRSKLGSAADRWQQKQQVRRNTMQSSPFHTTRSDETDWTRRTSSDPFSGLPVGWNDLHQARDLLKGAGYASGAIGGAQIGMLRYRLSQPINSRVIPFPKFAQGFRWMGKTSRGLGGTARFVGAPLSVLMDYNAMQQGQISQTRFIYRTSGTVSSIVTAAYVGAMMGGPYGAAAGLAVGFAFIGGEIAYDVVSNLVDELTQGITDSERALRELQWGPGF